MINGFSSIMIFVKDQDESLEFWVGKLNFTVLKDIVLDSKLRWVQITPPESQGISLILYPRLMITNRKFKPLPVIIFKTINIKTTIEQLKIKGIIFSHAPMQSELGEYVMFKDNEGNDFIIMQHSNVGNKR